MMTSQTFRLVLIKPSHYDDDGYVIQWYRSWVPSNTLSVIYRLAQESAKHKVLGEDVNIEVDAYDETNTVLPIRKIIKEIQRAGNGMVGLIGVQSNQFPRSVDIASPFIEANIPVIIGGFHVSGCLAMLDKIPSDIQAAMDKGITIVAGEAEEKFDDLLRQAYHRTLQPLYNFMDDLPDLERAPYPFLPSHYHQKTVGRRSSFDAGRGCPFECSFCTIINVQGRKSRWRSADDIEALIRVNLEQGVRQFFITDDDFARNRNWEAIMDRCIKIREEEKHHISLLIQVDVLCHKIPRFIEKSARAGVRTVFIGLENINPETLASIKKRQNKIREYRKMIQEWQNYGCMTIAGYILGFPNDTPESIARDIEVIKKELPIDFIQFNCLTPLPGSEDHQSLARQGVWMEPDMNNYDIEHITTEHPRMSKEEWQQAYRDAWDQYYSAEHIETIHRRAAAKVRNEGKVFMHFLLYYGCFKVEGVHITQGGFFRRKVRTSRRSGLPLENPFLFYPRRVWEVVCTNIQWALLAIKIRRIRLRVKYDPKKREYLDLAITPVAEQENEDLTLMNEKAHQGPVLHITKKKAVVEKVH